MGLQKTREFGGGKEKRRAIAPAPLLLHADSASRRRRLLPPSPAIMIHYCTTFSQKRISITATCALVALPCGVSVFSLVPLTIPAALAHFKASSA